MLLLLCITAGNQAIGCLEHNSFFRDKENGNVSVEFLKRKIELLAPGGDVDSIKAAIAAGADAIYCGLDKFNARNRAVNIKFEDLNGIIHLAHANDCKVFLTLNIIIVDSEIPTLIRLLNKLVNTKIDGVIVQDFGLLYLLSTYFKDLEVHASTQLTTHNEGQIQFLNRLNVTRVNLSRELRLAEIKELTVVGHQSNISTEVFVHGSYCISFSGLCYISSVLAGKSGNRGRCSQPCRDRYVPTPQGKNFPLNLKDNSAYSDLRELYDAGVGSVKIEGRKKKCDYVYTVVNCYKKQLQRLDNQNSRHNNNSDLYKVFNRDFSNGYLKGDISKDLFIDNPRDHSIKQFAGITDDCTDKKLLQKKREYYEGKARTTTLIAEKVKQLSIAQVPVTISISGDLDTPLKVTVKTPDAFFEVFSEMHLASAGTDGLNQPVPHPGGAAKTPLPGTDDLAGENRKRTAACLNYDIFFDRFKVINRTEYYIEQLDLENLENDLFLPFKELTLLKKKILYILLGAREFVAPIDVPIIRREAQGKNKPALSVLISSQKDLHLCDTTSADIFFQLPNCFPKKNSGYVDLFRENKKIFPWFPSILIGENYTAAVNLLEQTQPGCIVTNNTGIAWAADKRGIPWIAGPYLNIVNSFGLLCLKEQWNCSGAFISNEMSRKQIKALVCPDDFKLHYSIYHPIMLMNSRQCLFHQVTGCEKERIDAECLQRCTRSSLITNLNDISFSIEKSPGNYHCVYHNNNYLNVDIVTEVADTFSSFLIDLRDIHTETQVEADKITIIKLFEDLLHGNPDSKRELKQRIHPTTHTSYTKGI